MIVHMQDYGIANLGNSTGSKTEYVWSTKILKSPHNLGEIVFHQKFLTLKFRCSSISATRVVYNFGIVTNISILIYLPPALKAILSSSPLFCLIKLQGQQVNEIPH